MYSLLAARLARQWKEGQSLLVGKDSVRRNVLTHAVICFLACLLHVDWFQLGHVNGGYLSSTVLVEDDKNNMQQANGAYLIEKVACSQGMDSCTGTSTVH